MSVLVISDDADVVAAAVKEHGAEAVSWYACFSRRRDASNLGIGDRLLAKQSMSVKEAEAASDWATVIGGSKKAAPAPKAKKGEKKGAVKSGDE
mgnify:CR=1 FL=1